MGSTPRCKLDEVRNVGAATIGPSSLKGTLRLTFKCRSSSLPYGPAVGAEGTGNRWWSRQRDHRLRVRTGEARWIWRRSMQGNGISIFAAEASLARLTKRDIRTSSANMTSLSMGSSIEAPHQGESTVSTHQIHVFISHSWSYSGHYKTLSDWIFEEKWSVGQASLDLRDFSGPKDDPIHGAKNERELRKAIYNQIARSHVLVIPLGMYANYSDWIQKEIDGAQAYIKPVLGVNPWGQQRNPSVVAEAADEIESWNKNSVVGGIWKLFRQ